VKCTYNTSPTFNFLKPHGNTVYKTSVIISYKWGVWLKDPLAYSFSTIYYRSQIYNMECGLVAGEVPVGLLGPAELPLSKAPYPQLLHGASETGSLFALAPLQMHVCNLSVKTV